MPWALCWPGSMNMADKTPEAAGTARGADDGDAGNRGAAPSEDRRALSGKRGGRNRSVPPALVKDLGLT